MTTKLIENPAARESLIRRRFTLDGSAELERRLTTICAEVLSAVRKIVSPRHLEALVLGGGYGRGQGGVLRTAAGDQPYNDMEFYVFVRGIQFVNQHRYQQSLTELGERLSPSAGLHVEFKLDSLARFRRRPVSMFSYDLISGHRILAGPPNLFAQCGHHRTASGIPMSEATRLLFNRCTGLLLARERMGRSDAQNHSSDDGRKPDGARGQDADFIARNLAKAQLALGDVVLTVFKQYHWNCKVRHQRLLQLVVVEPIPHLRAIRAHHAAGVDYKLHPRPDLAEPARFEQAHQEISLLTRELWLWLEHRRLGPRFASVRDYALARELKCPESSLWRNYLLNLRTFGLRIALDAFACRYPRERLFNALPLLLWNGEVSEEPTLRQHLQTQLFSSASDWSGLLAAYKKLWAEYG